MGLPIPVHYPNHTCVPPYTAASPRQWYPSWCACAHFYSPILNQYFLTILLGNQNAMAALQTRLLSPLSPAPSKSGGENITSLTPSGATVGCPPPSSAVAGPPEPSSAVIHTSEPTPATIPTKQ